ncbi:hypothetical protein BJ684DRAFT_15994 [Piptocephalis cylindrospora]|uniref:B-block binding subunit of TFIIIC domain-containing protein n=1 Tax=Piptocephalis cylindrospora TaxID=1907219 RepID=A0A4P9Y5X8_9FUNG|nr:hypothetical protein BJ684DRAFT_15994 [Piptocephalis cylindrospora]|eukprot:RKP13631.1 hypothetical protein BJ684DRAFT_15994 [Piptocephalis cylindrospora]
MDCVFHAFREYLAFESEALPFPRIWEILAKPTPLSIDDPVSSRTATWHTEMDEAARAYYWKYLRQYDGLIFHRKTAPSSELASITSAAGIERKRLIKDTTITADEREDLVDVTALTLEEIYQVYGPEGVRLTIGVTEAVRRRYLCGVTEESFAPKKLETLSHIARRRERGMTQIQLTKALKSKPQTVFHFVLGLLKDHDQSEDIDVSSALLKIKREKLAAIDQEGIEGSERADHVLQSGLISRQVLVLLEKAQGRAIHVEDLIATLLPKLNNPSHRRWFNRLMRHMQDDGYLKTVKVQAEGSMGAEKSGYADVDTGSESATLEGKEEEDEVEVVDKVSWKNARRCAILLPAGAAWLEKDRKKEKEDTRDQGTSRQGLSTAHMNAMTNQLDIKMPGQTSTLAHGRGLQVGLALEQQVYRLLQEAGRKGATQGEMEERLGGINHKQFLRGVEHLGSVDPTTKVDTFVQVVEFEGRERRFRYYSSTAYADMMREGKESEMMGMTCLDGRGSEGGGDIVMNDSAESLEKGRSGEASPRPTNSTTPRSTPQVIESAQASAKLYARNKANIPSASQVRSVNASRRRQVILDWIEADGIIGNGVVEVRKFNQRLAQTFPDTEGQGGYEVCRRTFLRTVRVMEAEKSLHTLTVHVPLPEGGSQERSVILRNDIAAEDPLVAAFVQRLKEDYMIRTQASIFRPIERAEGLKVAKIKDVVGEKRKRAPGEGNGGQRMDDDEEEEEEEEEEDEEEERSSTPKDSSGRSEKSWWFRAESLGYIRSKFLRARALHEFIVRHLQDMAAEDETGKTDSSSRTFRSAILLSIFTLDLYLKIVGHTLDGEALNAFLDQADDAREMRQLRDTRLVELPLAIREDIIGSGRYLGKLRNKTHGSLQILQTLGLVVSADEDTDADGSEEMSRNSRVKGKGRRHKGRIPSQKEGLHYLYTLPLRVTFPEIMDEDGQACDVESVEQAERYWVDLQTLVHRTYVEDRDRSGPLQKRGPSTGPISHIFRLRSWIQSARVTLDQRRSLMRYVDRGTGRTPYSSVPLCRKIAGEIRMPVEQVSSFYWKVQKDISRRRSLISQKKRQGGRLLSVDRDTSLEMEDETSSVGPRPSKTLSSNHPGALQEDNVEEEEEEEKGGDEEDELSGSSINLLSISSRSSGRRSGPRLTRLVWSKDMEERLLFGITVLRLVAPRQSYADPTSLSSILPEITQYAITMERIRRKSGMLLQTPRGVNKTRTIRTFLIPILEQAYIQGDLTRPKGLISGSRARDGEEEGDEEEEGYEEDEEEGDEDGESGPSQNSHLIPTEWLQKTMAYLWEVFGKKGGHLAREEEEEMAESRKLDQKARRGYSLMKSGAQTRARYVVHAGDKGDMEGPADRRSGAAISHLSFLSSQSTDLGIMDGVPTGAHMGIYGDGGEEGDGGSRGAGPWVHVSGGKEPPRDAMIFRFKDAQQRALTLNVNEGSGDSVEEVWKDEADGTRTMSGDERSSFLEEGLDESAIEMQRERTLVERDGLRLQILVKATILTPEEEYDSAVAFHLLHRSSTDRAPIGNVIQQLMDKGILSKHKPVSGGLGGRKVLGRGLHLTERFATTLANGLPEPLFPQAVFFHRKHNPPQDHFLAARPFFLSSIEMRMLPVMIL